MNFLFLICLIVAIAVIVLLLRQQKEEHLADENEKQTLLEVLGEGVFAVDSDMRLKYVNAAACRIIGRAKKQLIGKTLSELAPHTHPEMSLLEKCLYLLTFCQKSQSTLTDTFFADKKKLYLDLIATPISPQRGALLLLQDKSSHHKVLDMGKDFVANASHELRTPITIIRGFAETLSDLPELPREMIFDITEKIVRNCQRMENLVKNLLTLADLENLPASRFQECDLVALIENCRQLILSIYKTPQISIVKCSETVIVDADPDILELAIINLLDNSVKYSTPPATIHVCIEQGAADVSIQIKDKGIGIPPEDVEHIFERFYTVDKAHSRRLGGSGLGLSIVKTILEKHEGSIYVSSQPKTGTTFTLTLPTHR